MKPYIALNTIDKHKPGSVLELDDKQAERLLRLNAIRSVDSEIDLSSGVNPSIIITDDQSHGAAGLDHFRGEGYFADPPTGLKIEPSTSHEHATETNAKSCAPAGSANPSLIQDPPKTVESKPAAQPAPKSEKKPAAAKGKSAAPKKSKDK